MEVHEKDIIKHKAEEKVFMRTFSSQEEAETYQLKKDLERTDMERFRMLCRMMRIGRMLTPSNPYK